MTALKTLALLSMFCVFNLSNPATASSFSNPDTTNLTSFQDISYIPFIKNAFRYDTLLRNVHVYNVLAVNDFWFSQGNIGHAHYPLKRIPLYSSGFIYGPDSYYRYMLQSDSLLYGLPRTSMTDIYYIMGAKKEQSITVNHLQKIRHSLFGGLTLRMFNSPGYYKQQKSDVKNFSINTHYLSKNEKYGFVGHYIHNNLKLKENGGIQYDSIFEKNIETDRQIIDVRLQDASNALKQNIWFFRQYYSFLKPANTPDSLKKKVSGFFNPGQISHSFRIGYFSEIYKDIPADSSFYVQTFDKLHPTYDSLRIIQSSNKIAWTNRKSNIQVLVLDLGLMYQHTRLHQATIEKTFDNLVFNGKLCSSPSENFLVSTDLSITNGTYYSGDLDAGFSSMVKIGHIKTSGSIRYAFFHPDYFYSNFESNHFRWSNDFNRIRNLTGTFTAGGYGLSLNLILGRQENLVFLNEMALPEQFGRPVNYLSASISKKIELKRWHFSLQVIYQESSDQGVYPVPELFAQSTILYRNELFNKASRLETGIDGYWFSPWYALKYMPALRSFYVQNEKKTGGFIYPEIFVDLQVKRARIFLKYVNPLMGRHNYYHIPHYPLQDAGFRFGLSWMFYD